MKNLKKITALVIVLAMALSSVAFAGFSDVSDDSAYAEAINVMAALGIINGYEDGTFGPEKTITRAEFTTMVINALGMDNVGTVNTQFTDVTSNHWASGYISAGVAQGFVNGYDATTFGPDDEVTYEQAVKMLICAIGYTPKFQIVKKLADGTTVRELDPSAYPSAYLAEANTAGITTGVNQKVGDKASREVVAKLVYNALTTPMMEQTSFGSDPEWSVPTSNYKTLLVDYLKVDKIEASVGNVSFDPTSAKKVSVNPTKLVEVDDQTDYATVNQVTGALTAKTVNALYDPANVDPNANRGYSCVMYFDNNADDATVLAMFPKTGRNNTLTLTKDQFAPNGISDGNGGTTYDATKLKYYKNNDNDATTLTAKLNPVTATDTNGVVVYVNKNTATLATGANIAAFASEFSKGKASAYTAVELIDNDNDGDYDVIFATAYDSMVVGEINEKTYRIQKNAESAGLTRVTLDPESEDTVYDIVDANGNALAFEDIVVGDILNVYTSTDAGYKHLKVMVTKDTITGTVTSKDTSEGTYTIGGTEYKSAASIDIGDAGTFYVDAYGKIIMVELDATSRNFGFVYNADIDDYDFEKEAALVILDQAGKYTTYNFAKNVQIIGTAGKTTPVFNGSKEGLLSGGALIAAVDNLEGQIVAYEVNGSNEITAIYDEAGIETINSGKYDVKINASAGYKASTQSILSGFISEEVPMWALKTSAYDKVGDSQGTDTKKTDFSLAYSTAFADAKTYSIKAVIDQNNNNNIVAAVVYDMLALADPESAVMYVTGVGEGRTEDGDVALTLTGYVDNELVTTMVTADSDVYRADGKTVYTWNSIAKGDVLQITGGDVASGVTVIVTAAELATPASIVKSAFADEDAEESLYLTDKLASATNKSNGWLYVDKVAKLNGNVVNWATQVNGDDVSSRIPTTVPTMIYRPSTQKVYAGLDYDPTFIETNENFYGATEVGTTENNDYMVVYAYDGTVYAVVIVDTDADTEF